MYYLYLITSVALCVSLAVNRDKTFKAIEIAFRQFVRIFPAFLSMLILVSVTLSLIPEKVIINYLSNNNIYIGTLLASVFGSITLMPGFIAYPLSGILLKKGVSYMVLSSFVTTLMMVGILTYPMEKEYFGVKVTIIRNSISYIIALIVALVTGLLYGELEI